MHIWSSEQRFVGGGVCFVSFWYFLKRMNLQGKISDEHNLNYSSSLSVDTHHSLTSVLFLLLLLFRQMSTKRKDWGWCENGFWAIWLRGAGERGSVLFEDTWLLIKARALWGPCLYWFHGFFKKHCWVPIYPSASSPIISRWSSLSLKLSFLQETPY